MHARLGRRGVIRRTVTRALRRLVAMHRRWRQATGVVTEDLNGPSYARPDARYPHMLNEAEAPTARPYQ